MNKYEYIREGLAATLSGAMAGCTAIIAVVQDKGLTGIDKDQWVIIGVGAFIAAAQGWKQLLSRPPRRFDDDPRHT